MSNLAQAIFCALPTADIRNILTGTVIGLPLVSVFVLF
jgi:hypothetical protein